MPNDSNEINEFSKFVKSLPPNEFALTACLFGFIISQPLDSLSQQSVGNFLELVGQVILTISSQQITVQGSNNASE